MIVGCYNTTPTSNLFAICPPLVFSKFQLLEGKKERDDCIYSLPFLTFSNILRYLIIPKSKGSKNQRGRVFYNKTRVALAKKFDGEVKGSSGKPVLYRRGI